MEQPQALAVPGYMISGTLPGTQNLHETLPPLLEELQIEYPAGHNRCTLLQATHPPFHAGPGTIRRIRDTARAKDVTNMQQLAENKDFCLPQLNRVISWNQEPIYSASHHPKDTMDENLPALMEVFLAFEKVGFKFEWVTEVLFKHTPFGRNNQKMFSLAHTELAMSVSG